MFVFLQFYPSLLNTPDATGISTDYLFNLFLKRPYSETNNMAYNASYASLSAAKLANSSTPVNDPAFRKKAFEFCNIDGYYCSIVMFNSVNYVLKSVSTHLFQLADGTCTNSVSLSDATWKNAKSLPPTDLSESYFTCVFTVRHAF